MITAWTIFISLILVTFCVVCECIQTYRQGNSEEGAKAFLFTLFLAVVASIPAQYIFGG